MNPLGTRARVEELARLLDGAVAGPGSLTAGYAGLATRLRTIAPALEGRVAPRPEFRATLRQRLVAVATVQAASGAAYAEPLARPKALDAAVSWTQTRRAQRRIGVTAGAMAGVIAFTGVGIAASQSLPGQPFYGLKRTSEDAQLRFTSGDTAKGAKHLEFAATRLREVKALADGEGQLSLGAGSAAPVASGVALGGSLSSRITDTLEDFNEETNSGRSLLESVYRKTGKPEPLRILKSFSTQQKVTLTTLLPTLPAGVQGSAQDSLDLITEVGSDASQLLALGTCGGECYPGNGGPTLTTEPVPTPGVTASPAPSDNNGVPPCVCEPGPTPAPAPTPEPAPKPTPSTEPTPTPAPTPTPTPSSSPSPGPLPTLPVPVPVPTLPTPLPTLPVLPSLLPLLQDALPVEP